MISYKSLMTRDDHLFTQVAKCVIRGAEYHALIDDAKRAYESAYDEANGTRAPGIAKRAENIVILSALRNYGVTSWREINTKNPPPKITKAMPPANIGKVPDGRKYNSQCGLWSNKI